MACDKDAADTIENYTIALQTSILLEHRRDACRGLRSLARDFRVQVGAQAMDLLIQTIQNDKQDVEIVNYCLDSINYIISGSFADSPAATWPEAPPNDSDNGKELSEILLKRNENVTTIIDTIRDNEFKTRWIVVRILCGLARHKLDTLQDAILSDPLNLPRLSQLISDKQDLIRNDALVLFVKLTQNNTNIQNVLAYDNLFDKIMSIIALDEGYMSGTMAVVNDCLNIVLNMLKCNEANQILFREGGHIQKFLPFFDSIQTISWTFDESTCIVLVLQVLDNMVSSTVSLENVRRSQEIMQRCGILDRLCDLLTASSMPIGVLSETMNAASDIVRGHLEPNANTVMKTSAMMPVILLGMVKEICQAHETRVSEICQAQETRISENSQGQETRISELYNYVHLLHEFISKPK